MRCSLIFLGGMLIFSGGVFAQQARVQNAIINEEGAIVYQAPNFDSPVVEELRPGTRVRAMVKVTKGIGGLGLFYKVKTPSGKVGFITDIDILTEFKSQAGAAAKTRQPVKKNPVYEDAKEKQENPNREPVFMTKYMGGGLGYLSFTEKLAGKKFSSDVPMIAFKMIGPGILIDGPPLDFNFSFSPEVPGYYEKVSRGPANGFFIFSDLLLSLPLYEFKKGVIHYGLGLMGTYTNFKATVRPVGHLQDVRVDSQELRVGGALALGYTHRFGRFALRWDTKYYYEKTGYLGHWLSFVVER